MTHSTKRILAILAICLSVGLVFVSVLHLIAPSERIARTVYKSLESAFSGALTVEAVEVESLNRVVLRTVGYSAENGFPLNVQIEQVGIELGFPVAHECRAVLPDWSCPFTSTLPESKSLANALDYPRSAAIRSNV